jgi:hypothetical protein
MHILLIEEEAGDPRLEALASCGGMRGTQEALKRNHTLSKGAVPLHAFSSPLLRSHPPTSRPTSSMDLAAHA